MKSRQKRPVLRLAWFDEEQWKLLCTLVPDRGELDDTYQQWQESARRAVREIKSNGHTVECVPVDVAAMAKWCRDRNLPLNGAARAQYVITLAPMPADDGT